MLSSKSKPWRLKSLLLPLNLKLFFFLLLGLLTLSVFAVFERVFVVGDKAAFEMIITMKWLLVPHAVFGFIALVIGQLQFASRIRTRNIALHRKLGKVYVFSVLIASFFAVLLNLNYPFPGVSKNFIWENITQSSVWFITALMAWILARKRQITLHKMWMSRSYGMTFIFVLSRFIIQLPFLQMDLETITHYLWFLIVFALVVPEILLNWREFFAQKQNAGLLVLIKSVFSKQTLKQL